jgi:hypothetical protein
MNENEIKDLIQEGYIRFEAIIELAGKPKPHLGKAVTRMVGVMDEDKALKLIKRDVAKPEEKNGMFVTFIEVDALAKSKETLIDFCFNYMPSSIEVIDPSSFKLDARELSTLLVEVQGRVHTLDMQMKTTNQLNKVLNTSMHVLMKNMVRLSVATGPKTLEQLQRLTGIPEKDLNTLLESLIKEEEIHKDGETYRLPPQS